MIWFACKQCGKSHGRGEHLAGTLVFCECGHGNRVPWSSTIAEPEPEEAMPAPPPRPRVPPTPRDPGATPSSFPSAKRNGAGRDVHDGAGPTRPTASTTTRHRKKRPAPPVTVPSAPLAWSRFKVKPSAVPAKTFASAV